MLTERPTECVRLDASDVHISPGLVPYFRVHGMLEPHATFPVITAEGAEALATELSRTFDRRRWTVLARSMAP